MQRTKILKTVYTRTTDYTPQGYYNYPELFRCISFNSIELRYSANYMHMHIKPHDIKIKRRLHRKDRILYPDAKTFVRGLSSRNGKDIAELLNELDKYELIPKLSWYQILVRKMKTFFL